MDGHSRMARSCATVVALAIATIATTPSPTHAQGFGRNATQPWSGRIAFVDQRPTPAIQVEKAQLDLRATRVQSPPTVRTTDTRSIDRSRLAVAPAPVVPAQGAVAGASARVAPSQLVAGTTVAAGDGRGQGATVAAAGQSMTGSPKRVSVDLRPVLDSMWEAARPEIQARGEAFLKERDIGGGFRTSKNRLTLAGGGPLFVGHDGRGITLRVALPGNQLSTYLRTPGPAPEGLDPGFLVPFDLELQLDIEQRGRLLVAGPARLRPTVYPPQGKNLTGDLAVIASDLIRTLSGTDFVGQMLAVVNGNVVRFDAGLNDALAPVNAALARAPHDASLQPAYDAATQAIVFNLVEAGPEPVIH